MTPIADKNDDNGHDRVVRVVLFWIVLAFVLVQSTASIYLSQKAEKTSNIGNNTTCVLIRYLDGSAARAEETIKKEPKSSLTRQRQESINQAKNLSRDLKNPGVDC